MLHERNDSSRGKSPGEGRKMPIFYNFEIRDIIVVLHREEYVTDINNQTK